MRDRVSTLRAATLSKLAFANQLREAAGRPDITVIRLRNRLDRAERPYQQITGYTARYTEVRLDARQQGAVAELLYQRRIDLDWRKDHDYHLDTAMWRHSPEPHEDGYIPETDHQFGGTAPVFLPAAAPAARSPERAA